MISIIFIMRQNRKRSYIELLDLTREVLETSIDLLGFAAPERM